jgi:superfamily II DNA/RNA helicase
MISTEVASRGLDFPDLNHIILFDVPPSLADYGNRVGRSARFNSSGVSLLMLHYQESDYA